MWTFQKNDLPHTWLPETTGQWGRGPQRPQVARRHSRPRLPGTYSARFYIKANDSHFHRTNSTFVFISRTDEIMPLASAEEHPSNKMCATPGRLRGTWVRQSLLGPAALLLQVSSSQESANSTYLQCFKTLWRELLRLTILCILFVLCKCDWVGLRALLLNAVDVMGPIIRIQDQSEGRMSRKPLVSEILPHTELFLQKTPVLQQCLFKQSYIRAGNCWISCNLEMLENLSMFTSRFWNDIIERGDLC